MLRKPVAQKATGGLDSLCDRSRRSRTAGTSAWLDRFRASARDLVRLLRRLPGRAELRRPEPRPGVLERLAGPQLRAADDPRHRRDDDPAGGGLVARAVDACRLDILELRVHRRRTGSPLRLCPAPRALRALPEHGAARERPPAPLLRRLGPR